MRLVTSLSVTKYLAGIIIHLSTVLACRSTKYLFSLPLWLDPFSSELVSGLIDFSFNPLFSEAGSEEKEEEEEIDSLYSTF